jgi:hypothetical protein
MLNNNSDVVRLLHPDGTSADEAHYESSSPDVSRSRAADGSWYSSATASPGMENVPPDSRATPTPESSTATPTGTSLPGAASKQAIADPQVSDGPAPFHAAVGPVALSANSMPASLRGPLPIAPTYAAVAGTRYRGVSTAPAREPRIQQRSASEPPSLLSQPQKPRGTISWEVTGALALLAVAAIILAKQLIMHRSVGVHLGNMLGREGAMDE